MDTNNKCLICKVSKNRPIFKCETFSLFRCRNCDNTSLMSDKRQAYDEQYYIDRDAYYKNYKVDYSEDKYPIPMYKNILAKIKELGHDGGKLLEIGCSKGLFLHLADKQGFSVSGLDVSEYAAKYIKDNFGFPVACCDITDADFSDNFFDAIVMIDVIEHLENPAQVLKECCRVLRPGGLLVIDTPNENSLINLISFFLYKISFSRLKFFVRSNHDIEHLVYFSPKGIKKLLNTYSFEMLEVNFFNVDPSLRGLNKIVNLGARVIFYIADILRMQNKMLIFTRKQYNKENIYD